MPHVTYVGQKAMGHVWTLEARGARTRVRKRPEGWSEWLNQLMGGHLERTIVLRAKKQQI